MALREGLQTTARAALAAVGMACFARTALDDTAYREVSSRVASTTAPAKD
jgi:hypothetical protein